MMRVDGLAHSKLVAMERNLTFVKVIVHKVAVH